MPGARTTSRSSTTDGWPTAPRGRCRRRWRPATTPDAASWIACARGRRSRSSIRPGPRWRFCTCRKNTASTRRSGRRSSSARPRGGIPAWMPSSAGSATQRWRGRSISSTRRTGGRSRNTASSRKMPGNCSTRRAAGAPSSPFRPPTLCTPDTSICTRSPSRSSNIFSDSGRDELGIEPIFFRESFYCTRCGSVASEKTCPHGREHHITMSGTGVQDILRYGYLPPKEVLRPEVGQVILQGIQPKGVGADGQAIKPVGDTIKGLFPSYLTHARLGGTKRPQPLDPKTLNVRDLEAALRDTRDNASRVYERVYETYASLFDIERGAGLTLVEEARRKAIAIQEELIEALEQKVAIAPVSVEDPYMYQDREEAERELRVARKILDDLRRGGEAEFSGRVWNQRPYEDYRS